MIRRTRPQLSKAVHLSSERKCTVFFAELCTDVELQPLIKLAHIKL